MTNFETVAVLAAVALGAAAQASTGLGFSLVCAPFLITTLGPREGVRVGLVLSLLLNFALLLHGHRRVLVRTGALLAVPAVAATPLLATAVRRLDGRILAAGAGLLTIASAGALAVGLRWHRGTRPLAGVGVGVLSAAMNVVGSIGGPPVALFAVNAGWPRDRTGPTLQAIFLTTNLVGLASLGLPQRLGGWLTGGLLGAIGAGWCAGLHLGRLAPEGAIRSGVLTLAAIGGLAAVGRAMV